MIFIDTETTGFLKPNAVELSMQPFMTEICITRLDNNFDLVGEFESFIKPPIPIPPEVTDITGISDDTVRDAPSFIGIFDNLVNIFLGEKVLIAHNAPFDVGVLAFELMRYDMQHRFPWASVHHCTVEISMPIRDKYLSLKILHEIATGTQHLEGAHRAKNDVYALIRCYKWLVEHDYVELVS